MTSSEQSVAGSIKLKNYNFDYTHLAHRYTHLEEGYTHDSDGHVHSQMVLLMSLLHPYR